MNTFTFRHNVEMSCWFAFYTTKQEEGAVADSRKSTYF